MSSAYLPKQLRRRVAERSRYRCGYCWIQEVILGIPMEVDHLIPQSLGGPTEDDNLWLACSACNGHKGSRTSAQDPDTGKIVRLFNPRKDSWEEHFQWTDSGARIVGRTAIGRATVRALHLNRSPLVNARRIWIEAGWHPPED